MNGDHRGREEVERVGLCKTGHETGIFIMGIEGPLEERWWDRICLHF